MYGCVALDRESVAKTPYKRRSCTVICRPVSDTTFQTLVTLVADIARRNDLGKLVKGKNLTWHSMYATTACPGPYLSGKLQELVDKANTINGF